MRRITAVTIRERKAFIDEGLQIRSLTKRKYRLNDRRIKEATAAFQADEDVVTFLNVVSHSAENIIQRNFTEEDEEEEEAEEQLLGFLPGNIPAEYREVGKLLYFYATY